MFRVGQKVVCVNAEATRTIKGAPESELVAGAIYTVRWIGRGRSNSNRSYPGVRLVGIVRKKLGADPEPDVAFNASRFRPIVQRKTSIEIFKRLLVPGTKILETI